MPSIPFNKTRTLGSFPDTVISQSGKDKSIRGRSLGVQLTASEGHPWFSHQRAKHAKDISDVGGPFTSVKIQVVPKSYEVVNFNNFAPGSLANGSIHGPVHPNLLYKPGTSSGTFNPLWFGYKINQAEKTGVRFDEYPDYSSTDEFLSASGTTAIARCKPTNPVSSVAVMLGELKRDGIPILPGSELYKSKLSQMPKKGSEEYLNYMFGIKPLTDDLRSFSKAVLQSKKVLRQLERDSGRLVRRRYRFPSQTETLRGADRVGTLTSPTLHPFSYVGGSDQAVGNTTVTIKRDMWFSGAFTYYVANSKGSALERVAHGYQEFDKLFGGVDAETLWNLTPWSWATDWLFNTGDVIANLSDAASFGLVLPYGYIMERTSVRYDVEARGCQFKAGGPSRWPLSIEHTVLKRRQATPFGFGVTWDGLSTTQWSILAALGLSRKHSR